MRWTADHIAAVVELACGVGFLIWGLGRLDSPPGITPTVVIGAVFAFFVGWAWRSWRAGERRAASARTTAGRQPARTAPPVAGPPPVRPLTPDEETELARVVAVLAAEGILGPPAPDPALLAEAVADAEPPVTVDTVLMAAEEVAHHHPSVVLHHSQTEQVAEYLREQATDILRLAGTGLAGVTVMIDVDLSDGPVATPVRLRVATDGLEQVHDYRGRGKALSTVLHVALARILRERATGRRLAWVWCDAGTWISCLADGGVERLNAALGAAAGDGWAWVDEREPYAAGDPD